MRSCLPRGWRARSRMWHDRPVRDFARWLAEVMLNRSQRLAWRKARPDRKTGEVKIPTRVHLRDGFVSGTLTRPADRLRCGWTSSPEFSPARACWPWRTAGGRSGRGVISCLTGRSPHRCPFIFAEDRHGDRQAREALFCTFNADLGYFERTVLGVTQSAARASR